VALEQAENRGFSQSLHSLRGVAACAVLVIHAMQPALIIESLVAAVIVYDVYYRELGPF